MSCATSFPSTERSETCTFPAPAAPTNRAALPSCDLLRSAMLKTRSTPWKDKSSRAGTCACSSPNSVDLTTHGSSTRAEAAETATAAATATVAEEKEEEGAIAMAKTAAAAAATTTAGMTAAMKTAEKTVIAVARDRAPRTAVIATAPALDTTGAAAAPLVRAVVRRDARAPRHLVVTS